MPATTTPLRWDIFCNVVDNYGDIGVCWRLARQLVAEHGFSVRLWVDELAIFRHLCPEIKPDQSQQLVLGVEVRHWEGDFSAVTPGDIVIEAFACQLPEPFEAAMAECDPRPVWINLDYLSAEAWVSGCHTLPSPHPRLPLTKYFFFPGFNEKTGGLLRESNLESRRQAFAASRTARSHLLDELLFRPDEVESDRHTGEGRYPVSESNRRLDPGLRRGDEFEHYRAASRSTRQVHCGSLLVSLFSYENPALADLLDAWSKGSRHICCLVPATRHQPILERFAGRALQVGDVVEKGQLELHLVPFVPQTEYDPMLWLCDLNFVRGEDSFVRAQWAAKPMVWQIYPQGERTHLVKLTAFLDMYCDGLTDTEAETVRTFFLAWNGEGKITQALWEQWLIIFPQLQRHACGWQKKLIKQQDLCSSLVQFCRSKL